MIQYCRYCVYCMTANGNWCGAKEKELTDSQIKHTNHCKLFEFTPMDAYDLNNEYKPRQKTYAKGKPIDNISLFEFHPDNVPEIVCQNRPFDTTQAEEV